MNIMNSCVAGKCKGNFFDMGKGIQNLMNLGKRRIS